MTITLPQETQPVKLDGVVYDPAIGEHRVIIDGVTVNYATHWSTALYQYYEALRIRREHYQANGENE